MLELGDFSGPGRAPALGPVAELARTANRRDHRRGCHADLWLPNMRVQRTRSASLRSPLTRRPLGARKV
jgi:hypothetical protein